MSTNFNPLLNELRKLGLNKKESALYLLLLEKGSATVLEISKKLALSRPTVYRVIQQLKARELVVQGKEKNKSYFFASSPDSFLNILKIQRRKAEEQEREFLRIISALQSKYYSRSKKNEIKIYQFKTALEDFSNTQEKHIRILCFDSKNLECIKISRFYQKIKSRLGKVSIKEITNCEKSSDSCNFVQRKTFPFTIDKKFKTLIIIDKVFIINKKQAFCIEEENTVEFSKLIFDLLWSTIKN